MASRTRTLYVDKINRKAYSSLTSRITQPIVDFFVADEEILNIISVSPNPDSNSQLVFINESIVGSLSAALGIAGKVATGGAFLVSDPLHPSEVAAGIAYNATASAFQAALRAGLPTNYGAAVVSLNSTGDYYIDRVTIGPIGTPLTGDGTALFPACFVNVVPVRVGVAASGGNPGTSDVFRLVLDQQPAAYLTGSLGSGWTALPGAAVSVQTLVTGSASPVRNAVFRVSINADTYQGSFYLTSSVLGVSNSTTKTSAPINFLSSASDMQAQIIAGWGAGNEVIVTAVNAYTWDVEFSGDNINSKNLIAPVGDASGLSVPTGLQGTLDLRTESANAMLSGASNRNVYFQIKNDDGTPQTWLYASCTLNPTLISPEVLGSSVIPFPLTEAEGDARYAQKSQNLNDLTNKTTSFRNLWVMVGTTLGDLIYSAASGVATRLVGNVTTTRKFLRQTGTGSASAVPVWDTLTTGDLPFVPGSVVTLDADPDPALAADSDDLVATQRAVKEYADNLVLTGIPPWVIVSANYTATNGDRIQTIDGGMTITLPPSPNVGDSVPIEDGDLSWTANPIVIDRNGELINGGTANYDGNLNGSKLSCVYISVGYGWSIK